MKVSRKGFTLIEILVVISIVGLLSSVFLVGLSGFRSRGRDARRLADIKAVQQGVEIYYTQCGFYPGDATGGVCVQGLAGKKTWTALSAALTGLPDLKISKVPTDPLDNPAVQEYLYGVEGGDGQSYVIGATLENPGDRALDDDVDGNALTTGNFGVDCTDPIYCVKFYVIYT